MSQDPSAYLYRVQTAESERGKWRIRGYYPEQSDARVVAATYRKVEGVAADVTALDLTGWLERDEICGRLNCGLS